MEKKNVVFTKDGAKVGVKEMNAEAYADKTQRAFVKTWNAAQDGRYDRTTQYRPKLSRADEHVVPRAQ